MGIITAERASEIRGELTEKHGAEWLHHYATAIETEVLANAPLTILNNVNTSIGDLMATCKKVGRHAAELDQERKRLTALNAGLLEALKVAEQFMGIASDWNINEAEINGEMRSTYDWLDLVRAAIAAATAPIITRLPAEDTEGGAV